jgi:hypothetical protein
MQALMDKLNKSIKEQGLSNLPNRPSISMQEALIGIELLSIFLPEEPEIQPFLSPKDKQNLELLSK